jgi:hypothetical protein
VRERLLLWYEGETCVAEVEMETPRSLLGFQIEPELEKRDRDARPPWRRSTGFLLKVCSKRGICVLVGARPSFSDRDLMSPEKTVEKSPRVTTIREQKKPCKSRDVFLKTTLNTFVEGLCLTMFTV